MPMNLQILRDSPLELPPGCKSAMEEQAQQMFREEDQTERQSKTQMEIPSPGKASVAGSAPEECPARYNQG